MFSFRPRRLYSKKGSDEERYDFSPSDRDIEEIFEEFGGDLKIPENFEPTVEAFDPQLSAFAKKVGEQSNWTSCLVD